MHITEFLERAAPAPTGPLDVEALVAKALRPHWYKRRWVWLTGLIAVVGAAVPTGVALSPASSPGTRVEAARPPSSSQQAAAPTAERSDPGAAAAGAAASNGSTRSTVAVRPVSPVSNGAAPHPPTAPIAPVIPSATAGSGQDECVLQGGEAGVDTPGGGGAGVGNFPECEYTAKSAAGYLASGSWRMTVTKPDGTMQSYGPGNNSGFNNGTRPTCGPLGVVQPGDRVDVILYTGAENAANVYYVKVGPTYHC